MRHVFTFFVFMSLVASVRAVSDSHVFVVTADSNSGSTDALDIISPWTATQNVEQVSRDAFVRHFYGLHYVVNRSEGTIQIIDPATFNTIRTISVGSKSMPHDVLVVAPDQAYVSRYDSTLLYEINPVTGSLRDTIDLGVFADTDGLPEMSMMALDGNHLFVQIQRIARNNSFISVSPSYLAVIDIRTNLLIDIDPEIPGMQGIILTGSIPSFRMHVDKINRRLFVSTPGPRLDVSGGIEEIDLDTMQSQGFVYSEAQAGVDLGGFVMISLNRGYVIGHTDIVASSHLGVFDRDSDAPGQGEIYTSLWVHNDHLAYDATSDQLFYPDASAVPPGIHVFDTLTNTRLTDHPVGTGSLPVDLVVAHPSTPGEAKDLRVTGYDPGSGNLSFTYQQACGAINHNIVFGPLQDISSFGYTGQICGIGTNGFFSGFDPGPGSYFFFVMGTDGGGREGSYGLTSGNIERPEDFLDPVCVFIQDLTARCDP
jgi:hypothetical protein